MESVVLEEVFQTWKLFDDLVDSLLKPGSIDKGTIQILANMVMSKEFSRTFLYNKEPGISLQAYEDIVDKYHSFTTWLLGQFFYLLSRDDGEIIVDAQLSIIDQLSRTQVHIYADLANEYCKALDILCGYLKDPNKTIEITAFEPKENEDLSRKLNLKRTTIELNSEKMCLNLIKKILKILKFIITESITFYSVNPTIYTAMENLILLLSYRHFELPIFELFIEIFERINYNISEWNTNMLLKIRYFFSLFEQFVYDFYNNKNIKHIDKDHFEGLLLKYLESCRDLKIDIGQNDKRINKFVIKHCLEDSYPNKLICSEKIQRICVQNCYQKGNCFFKNVEKIANYVIQENNSVMFMLLKESLFKEICDYFETQPHVTHVDVYESNETWKYFCQELFTNLRNLECNEFQCKMQQKFEFLLKMVSELLSLKIKFYRKYKNTQCSLNFFSDSELLPNLFSDICKHYQTCKNRLDPVSVLRVLVNQLSVTENKNIDIVYHLVASPILIRICYKSHLNLPNNYIGNIENGAKLKANIKSLYSFVYNDYRLKEHDIFEILNEFFKWISSGLVKNLNRAQVDQIEVLHIKILNHFRKPEDPNILCRILESIPQLLNIFSDKEGILHFHILLPVLSSPESIVQQKIAEVIPHILCTSLSDFIKTISRDTVKIICEKCVLKCQPQDREKCLEKYLENEDNVMNMNFSKNRVDLSALTSTFPGTFLKTVLNYLIGSNIEVKIKALESMPSLSEHIPKFYSPTVTKMWIERAGETSSDVRKMLIKVVRRTISNGQNNPLISEATKNENLEKIFSVLLRLTKKSLQNSEYDLQETLLNTIDEIGLIDDDEIKLECLKIMLYFVMVPTSNQSYIAVNRCSKLSKKDGSGQLSIYKHNTEILCEIIIHLCYVNQYLIESSLQDSLVKVSVMLGFDGVKDFLIKEAKKLLPFLVAKLVKSPNVHKLIEDMATIMEVDISELLSRNYGNIFLHLFLGNMDRDGSKLCSDYLEKTAKLSGPKLRKSNIRVILNELLLNFHEKPEKVLTTLTLLAQEDNTSPASSIEDYLQPYFFSIPALFRPRTNFRVHKKEENPF